MFFDNNSSNNIASLDDKFKPRNPARGNFSVFFSQPLEKYTRDNYNIAPPQPCAGAAFPDKSLEIVFFMEISELLRQSGVKMSDTAVVYCTLNSKEADLQELLAALTGFFAQGTLVMPSGHDKETSVPGGIFDPLSTPSGDGELSEMFRLLPGVVRSCHPVGALAFLGTDSQYLSQGHEKSLSGFSPSSPWWKLFQKEAKCIFIGCGLERSGMIAAAEEWAGAAKLSRRCYRRRLALSNGKNRQLKVKFHLKKHYLNYPKAEELLRDSGFLSRSKWGNSDLVVLDSSPAVTLLMELLHRKPGIFGSRRRLRCLKNF